MLPLVLAGASLLGGLMGKAGGGAASERQSANNFAQQQGQLQNQQYGTQQSALANLLNTQQRDSMDRARLGVAAPSQRMRQAVLGSLLQNLQAAKVTPPAGVNMGQMSGGLTPDALSGAVRAGGGELQRQALIALLTGSDMPKSVDYVQQGMLKPPTLPTFKQPGKLESILSAGGLVGAGASGLMGLLGGRGGVTGSSMGGATGSNLGLGGALGMMPAQITRG